VNIKKRILGTVTLGAFVVGIAGTSMAAGPSAAKPATVSDYVVSAPKAKTPGGNEANVVPLLAAFAAGALVAEVLHHHIPQMEPAQVIGGNDAIFDL
jgi:hypothetical protein